jgi:hypothetical protein
MSTYARIAENALRYFGQLAKQISPYHANLALVTKPIALFQFFLLRAVLKSLLVARIAVVQDAPVVLVHPVIRINLTYQFSYLTNSSRLFRFLVPSASAG